MKLFERYLVDLNTYPTFKKPRIKRLLEKKLHFIIVISVSLLVIKILAEWFAEYLLGRV